eukprot:2427946-Rhodomonas_salina.1
MPVLVGKEVPDEITAMCRDHVVANSHDLWAMLLLSAMERGCKADNEARAETQKRFVEDLFAGVRALKQAGGDGSDGGDGKRNDAADGLEEKVYELFGVFTRANICALSS